MHPGFITQKSPLRSTTGWWVWPNSRMSAPHSRAAYMAAMGPDGMAQAAEQSMAKAHYLEKALCALPGVEPVYGGAYFHEFVLKMPRSQELLEALDRRGILGGLPLGDDRVLWCATEKVSRQELDEAVSIVKEVLDR